MSEAKHLDNFQPESRLEKETALDSSALPGRVLPAPTLVASEPTGKYTLRRMESSSMLVSLRHPPGAGGGTETPASNGALVKFTSLESEIIAQLRSDLTKQLGALALAV